MSAKRVLIKLVHAPDGDTQRPLKANELDEFTNFTSKLSRNFDVKWGIGRDTSLGDKVKLTLLATGFDVTIHDQGGTDVIRMTADGGENDVVTPRTPQEQKDNISTIYSPESLRNQQRKLAKAKYAVLKPAQFDDDRVIDMLESTPAYNRSPKFNEQLNSGADSGTPLPAGNPASPSAPAQKSSADGGPTLITF